MNKDDNGLLHIYGQLQEHDDVWIVGNRKALTKLYNTIGTLLNTGMHMAYNSITMANEVMTADGEGYEIRVICNNTPWSEDYWHNLGLPYSSPSSQDMREGIHYPWDKKNNK